MPGIQRSLIIILILVYREKWRLLPVLSPDDFLVVLLLEPGLLLVLLVVVVVQELGLEHFVVMLFLQYLPLLAAFLPAQPLILHFTILSSTSLIICDLDYLRSRIHPRDAQMLGLRWRLCLSTILLGLRLIFSLIGCIHGPLLRRTNTPFGLRARRILAIGLVLGRDDANDRQFSGDRGFGHSVVDVFFFFALLNIFIDGIEEGSGLNGRQDLL